MRNQIPPPAPQMRQSHSICNSFQSNVKRRMLLERDAGISPSGTEKHNQAKLDVNRVRRFESVCV